MSKRLDQDREKTLQPKRLGFAIDSLKALGFEITCETENRVDFIYKGNTIQFYPYSGWHTGKGIKDGRGWKKLKAQLTR